MRRRLHTDAQRDAIHVGICDRAARIGAHAWWTTFEDHGGMDVAYRVKLYPGAESKAETPTEPSLKRRVP